MTDEQARLPRSAPGAQSEDQAEEAEPETTAALPPARLGMALRMWLRETWDRLGLVLAISLTWTLLLSLPLTVGHWLPATLPILARIVIVLLTAVLVLSAPVAGAFMVAHLACARDEVSYADF